MWEPMGFIFLWVMMSAMKDWFAQAKDESMQENQRRTENVGTD
jgi:hypothetical protein